MEEEVNESRSAAGLSGKNLDDPASLWKNSPQFKKNLEVILSQKQLSESIHCSSPGETRHKACVKNLVCAGRALRNAFLSNGKANWKAHVRLAKIIRRTYNGLELVEWLMDHCKFIDNRVMASKVWNTLLSIKMLQPVNQQKLFRDSRSLYQFTFEECESQTCNFRNPANWMDAVHLLLQLLPNVYQKGGYYQESLDEPDKTVQDPVIKKSILNHLTIAVQHELLAALAHRQYTKSSFVENSLQHLRPSPPTSSCPASSWPPGDAAAHVCESHEEMTSARPPPSPVRRYTPLPAAPEKVVEHLLFHLRLDEEHRNPQSRETDLLDDFLLTYPVFMSTSDLCQALLGHYCSKKGRMKEEGRKTLLRKRKVLHLLSQWSLLSADPPQDDEPAKLFLTTLYRYVLDDLFEFPSLEKDLNDLQKLLRMHRRCTIDDYSPQRKNKVLYQQLSLKDNWRPIREAQTEGKEVLCHLYVTVDSYVSIRTHSKVSVQELLRIVEERLDCAEDDIVLVAVTYTGDKVVLQADQCVFSSSLRATQRLHVCRRDMTEINSLFTDNGQQCSGKMLNMNTWDVAVSLTNCDWSLFNKVHEQELVYFTLSRDGGTDHTVALEQMLQRCNETQQWVMSEVLLCSTLGKRVQIFKKFIKIAAHCKAQRNFNSFFSIILGLNGPAVGRLTQTWEKIPGKFKKLFSELESLTDPSLNHKAYRDAFRKMKSPKIPFLPLLLKDITFIHEGNKTFLDNQVNFAKLHMIADVVRVIRQSRTEHMGNMLFQKDSVDVRTYINYLHVVDNQETLFELSHRLEPKT